VCRDTETNSSIKPRLGVKVRSLYYRSRCPIEDQVNAQRPISRIRASRPISSGVHWGRYQDRIWQTQLCHRGHQLVDRQERIWTSEHRCMTTEDRMLRVLHAWRVLHRVHAAHSRHILRRHHAAGLPGGKNLRAAGRPILTYGMSGAEVSYGFQIAAPTLRPWETGKQEEERENRNVDAYDGMNVFPEGATA
jgi:hypothetical protein